MIFVLFLLASSIEPTTSALEFFLKLGTGQTIVPQDQDVLKRLFSMELQRLATTDSQPAMTTCSNPEELFFSLLSPVVPCSPSPPPELDVLFSRSVFQKGFFLQTFKLSTSVS